MAKKGVVKDWTKNASSAIKYTAVDLTSESAPFLTNTISNAASAVKDMVDWIKRNSPEKNSNANKEPFLKRAVNSGKDTFKLAMEDIKAGNLNFDGINKKFSNGMDDMLGDFDSDMDYDFGDDSDLFDDTDTGSGDSSSYEGLTGEMYASGLEMSTRANIDAIAESSSFISENTMRAAQASTKQMVAANFANTARLSSQLSDIILNTKATNDNMASLVEFNNNSISPFLSQAQQYMENTEQTLYDIKAILETRLINPEKEESSYTKKDLIGGGLDIKGYMKQITNSMPVMMLTQQYAGIFQMLNRMGVPLPDFIKENPMIAMGGGFNPLKSVAKYALPSLFGEKSKLKEFDTLLEGMMYKLADKLAQSDSLFAEFGQLFTNETRLNRSKYDQGVVAWTGKDSKVLQDVIPSYLSHIEFNTEETSDKLDDTIDRLDDMITILNNGFSVNANSGLVTALSNTVTEVRDTATSIKGKVINAASNVKNRIFGAGKSGTETTASVNAANSAPMQATPAATPTGKFTPVPKREPRKRRSREERYANVSIWDSNEGKFTTQSEIKESYKVQLDYTYSPFSVFYELVQEYFKLNPEEKQEIADMVNEWANHENNVDADRVVDDIIETYEYNSLTLDDDGVPIITRYQRDRLITTLLKANKEFIEKKSALIKDINSGKSIYRMLSDDYLKKTKSASEFKNRDEVMEQWVYKSGDQERIKAYELQKKLDAKKKERGTLPFKEVLSEEEFLNKYGQYDKNASWFDRFMWHVRNETNDFKSLVNDAAIHIKTNDIDAAAGKMVPSIYNIMLKGFTAVQNLLGENKQAGMSDDSISKMIGDIFNQTATEAANVAGKQAAVGAHRIPEEGWWLLHPNERVLTAEEANEYDEFMRMLRNGELVNAFTADPVKSEAIRKMNNWYNKISAKNSDIDYSKYDDLRGMDQDKLSAEVIKRYGAGSKIAGIFNDGKEAVVQKADGTLARLLFSHGKYQTIDETSTADDYYDLASMGKKKTGKIISDLFGDKAPVIGFSKDGRSAITKDENGKYHEYKIRRRKPQNADEERNLEDYTNKEIEKAETREDAQFEMQKEMTENIRSIAATTAGEAERSIKRDKADNADETKTVAKTLLGKLSGFLFGERDDNGFFTDGPFANIANKVVNSKRKLFHTLFGKGYVDIEGNVIEAKDVTKGAKGKLTDMMNSASETLFGKKIEDSETSDNVIDKRKVKYILASRDNGIIPKGKLKIKKSNTAEAIITEAAEEVAGDIREAGEATIEATLGDPEETEAELKSQTKKFTKETIAEYAKKLGKGALIGGIAGATFGTSLGVIPSMFLPGGPIAGALIGIGGSIISQTETFKRFVFGELDEKTGEREGGLISKNMQERFKKTLPFIAGGAALGLLQKFFLPAASLIPGPGGALMNVFFGNGPIAGALLGLGGGLLASSETFRKKIFGEEDEDGKLYGGILSKPTEAIRKFFKKNIGSLKGAGIGALAGLVGNRLAAVKFGGSGLLYNVFGAGGPIGAAIIGSAVGIASRSEAFQEMLFGKDTGRVDENGKPIRDKSGLLHKFLNVFEINVIRPIADWGEYARDSFVNWLKHDLGDHVKGIFRPLQEALGEAAEKVDEAFNGLGTFVAKAIGMVMHPVKKLLPALLKTGVNLGLGALTGSAKMVGGMISAPFKTLDFLLNASPLRAFSTIFGNPGGKHYKQENADFRDAVYGGGFLGGIRNWADFMFNHNSWLDKREEWGKVNLPNEEDSGFFYYNKRRDAKLDRKEVTDEYKRKKGITKHMQRWAAKDGFNSSIILDENELNRRKRYLSKKGVDTEGWTNEDLIDFMYSNDEKRKVKQQADEDAKLQREANQAEIETKEEIRTFKDIFIDFKNRIFNKDKVSDTNASDNTVTKQESEKLERKIETGDSVKIGDMPSEGAKEVLSALQANDHNKAQKAEEEEAKKKADAKTAEAQALGKKKDGNKSDDEKKTVKEKIAEYVENKGGMFATITDLVGKAAGLGIAALVATKIDWSGVFKTIKGAISGVINGFKENTEESRTYIDEETGEEVIAPSALDAQVVVPRLANSAFRFATGTNLSALLYNITGGKAGGLFGAASSKLGKVTMNAMAKPIAKITGAVGKAASNGKFYAEAVAKYGDDILAGSNLTKSEKFFTMIYKALDKMKNSKALQSIAGSKLGKAIDSLTGAFKKISTKFGKILGKNSGKLADAAAAGAAKTGASAAKDVVPVLNIIIWSAGAIAGSLNVANLFHLSSDLDADIWMRTVAAIIGFLKSTMVGSLIDIIAEILKDAADFDLWNFIAVPCYKVFASDEQDAALDASMKAVEDACEQYNQEHGTNLSVTEYNDQIRNRTLGTKVLGVLGLDNTIKETKEKKQTSTPSYATYAHKGSTRESDNEGYGIGLSPIGYGIDHYTQNDPRWGRRKYATRRNGLSTSMATGGCGPTALANAATQLGVNVNPMQVASMARTNGYTADGGTNARMFTDGVRQLGLKSTNIGRGGVRSALRRGQKVILSGKGSDGIYTKAGHIISARGLDSRGNAIVDDPLKRRSRRIPISKLTSNSTHAWAIGYGPDLSVEEAYEKFGSPNKHVVTDNSTNNSTELYYSYQQRYHDSKNPDRDWGDLSIYNGEYNEKYATIGDAGCLMTAIASLLSNVTKRDFDPLTFVKLYGANAEKTYKTATFATYGDVKLSADGKKDAIIDVLNADFGEQQGGVSGPFIEYLSAVEGTLSAEPELYEYNGSKDLLKGALYPRIKNSRATSMLGPVVFYNGSVDNGTRNHGLFGGYPVVLHGSGSPYTSSGSDHAIVIKGVFRKYDKSGKAHLYTTMFDPGKKDNNKKIIPLTDIINNETLSNTKRIITFKPGVDGYVDGYHSYFENLDWTDYATRIDENLGTTHGDLTVDVYSDTYGVKRNDDAEAKEPTNILEASTNFIKGLVSIAGNIFSALGTKDFMYKSIFSDKTSSLIGGNGFNESVRDLTQGLSDASEVYGSDWSYRVPETFSAESVGAINSIDYKNAANYLGVTPELLAAINNDAAYSTGIESQYQNIPSLPSGKLPEDVLLQMKMKLFPMIAKHESGGTTDSVITDTNNRVALGIGGFNASNASEVMLRLANKIDSLIAQANEAGVDNLGDLDGVRKNFNILAGTGSLDVDTWMANSDLLRKYAVAAKLNALSTSTKNTLSKILRQSGEYAKEAQIAVLDDLLNIYMQEPIKHYNSGDLLDPRSIMLMSEFGGYGPAHLEKTAMWESIKKMANVYNTPDKNVRAVREGMIDYYKNNVSSFTTGHATRISETASTLLDPYNFAGFVPDSIMPGATYGIPIKDDISTFMDQVYYLLNEKAADGKYDTYYTGTIVESIKNTITNQYNNGGITSTPEKIVKDTIKRYPITKSKSKPKTTTSTSYANLPMMVNSHDYSMTTTADNNTEWSNALFQTVMALSMASPAGIVTQTKKTSGTGSIPSFSSKPQMPLRNVGNGPSDYYSDADIYTDEESIAKYNANNPLPVKMDTKPIESRVDVVIQILRQILQVCNTNKSAEGYGTKAANPIGNSQKVRNAGIDIADRMPLYTKDMNEVHVDPLRQLFQTIAASPR